VFEAGFMHPVLRNLVKSIQYEPLFHSETSKFWFFLEIGTYNTDIFVS